VTAAPSAPPTGVGLWIAGARPRTLGAAISPVIVGTAVAYAVAGHVSAGRALLALLVAIALQIGVNYANDYSDGVRGTDCERVGPLRLTASGLVTPRAVRSAALASFAVAAVAGLALALIVTLWLVVVGAAAIAAAALYTGGPKPLGYLGLGELMVLVFFGFVATAGTAFVQLEHIPSSAWWGSVTIGLLACALLLANNIRDVATDTAAGKRTLAVRIGERRARLLHVACVGGAFLAVIPISLDFVGALAAFAALPLAVMPVRLVLRATSPPELVKVLLTTARLQLVLAVLMGIGLCLS
jgi:1,4-dihydroxy-2-naphthoate polyprenyltransferase